LKQQSNTSVAVVALLLSVCGTLAFPVSVRAAGPVDLLFSGIGEFELADGDKRTIAHHKTDKVYRICVVRSTGDALSVVVTFDDGTETIAQGSCADIEGKRIVVTPSGKMAHGSFLVGRYHMIEPD